MLCKGRGVATVNKNPEMSPFLLKAYSLVGEADTYTQKGNELNNKTLKNLNRGSKERQKERVLSGRERPPQREALKLRKQRMRGGNHENIGGRRVLGPWDPDKKGLGASVERKEG